jgi:flagellar hook protein FlgE
MSIWTTLYTGSSGITAFGKGISIIGDNIANVSTIGFKGSRAEFEAMLGGTAANGQREGVGVRMRGPRTLFEQGGVQFTGRALDLAIRGNGFFVVKGANEALDASFYTRNGQFNLDADGALVTEGGLRLQGYGRTPAGTLTPGVTDLMIPRQSPPSPTDRIDIAMNLDSRAEAPPEAFDASTPDTLAATRNHSTTLTIYDSLGTPRQVDVHLVKGAGNTWQWYATTSGENVGDPTTPIAQIGEGELTFNERGELDTQTGGILVDFEGATSAQSIPLSFGDAIADGGTGVAGSRQNAAPYDFYGLTQNGFGSGSLNDIRIDDKGNVNALYSNGQERSVGQVAIAMFGEQDKLRRMNDQLFAQTVDSGQALIDQAGRGSRGAILSQSVESSNVDISKELVTLIAYQRAFQSNARTVTTADELLQEISNLKR